MQRIESTTVPSNLLFVDTETKGTIDPEKHSSSKHTLLLGVAKAFRLEKSKRTRCDTAVFTKTGEFWSFVRTRLDRSRPLYVFAHNAGFDLTILDFWRFWEDKDAKINFAVLEDPPTVISITWKQCKLIFLDTLNYWRSSLAELAKSIGMSKTEMPGRPEVTKEMIDYCENDVDVIAKAIENYLQYILDNDLGPFCISQASQSMAAFKHRFMTQQIFIHCHEQALTLERESYKGGLVHCFFLGKVPAKEVYHVDVNSLYPSVMRNEYPTRFTHYGSDITVKKLSKCLESHAAVARVGLHTKRNTYPVYHQKRLIEATGQLTTTLAGPELRLALERGEVTKVHEYALYDKAVIFKDFVDHFWTERTRYPKETHPVQNNFAKIFMNSLYGKFGQRGYEWVECTWDNLQYLYLMKGVALPEEYTEKNFMPSGHWDQKGHWFIGMNEPIPIRYLGGLIQMKLPRGEHTESFPLVAAYVTSYGRVLLRSMIHAAGKRNVFYCDTDSLFTNRKGYGNLSRAGFVDGRKLGSLKLEHTYKYMAIYGAKDYTTDGESKIKGINARAIKIGEGCYLQNMFEGLRSILKRSPDPFIRISWIEKHLSRDYRKGNKRASGWVDFIRLDEK